MLMTVVKELYSFVNNIFLVNKIKHQHFYDHTICSQIHTKLILLYFKRMIISILIKNNIELHDLSIRKFILS